ncbi:hypothetical protein GCM10018966_093070 [Streptomyces yanii]
MSHAQVLGPVQIRTAERAVDLGPPKRRMVFAALAVDVGRPVSVGTLIRRVWGAEPALSRCWVCACLTGRRGMVGAPGPGLCSGRGGPADSAGDLVPDGEAVADFGSVVVCGHQVAAGSEVGRDPAERGQEPLGPT